jgi:hypothetical protein
MRCSAYFQIPPDQNIRHFALKKIPLSMEMALQGGHPAVSYHHAGANCSAGNPLPRGNPGQKHTRMDGILKTFDQKMNVKLKANVQQDRTNRAIHLQHLQPSPIS